MTVSEFRDICYRKSPRSRSRCRENTADDVRVLTRAALATRDEALKMDLLRRRSGHPMRTVDRALWQYSKARQRS